MCLFCTLVEMCYLCTVKELADRLRAMFCTALDRLNELDLAVGSNSPEPTYAFVHQSLHLCCALLCLLTN